MGSDQESVGAQPQDGADRRLSVARAMQFDLTQLRYAVAASEYGSFRRAAEALNLKQSTLSRRIPERVNDSETAGLVI